MPALRIGADRPIGTGGCAYWPREIARLIAFALAIGRQQRLAGQE